MPKSTTIMLDSKGQEGEKRAEYINEIINRITESPEAQHITIVYTDDELAREIHTGLQSKLQQEDTARLIEFEHPIQIFRLLNQLKDMGQGSKSSTENFKEEFDKLARDYNLAPLQAMLENNLDESLIDLKGSDSEQVYNSYMYTQSNLEKTSEILSDLRDHQRIVNIKTRAYNNYIDSIKTALSELDVYDSMIKSRTAQYRGGLAGLIGSKLSGKGKSVSLEVKKSALDKVYVYLEALQSPESDAPTLDLSANEKKALSEGRLGKIIAKNLDLLPKDTKDYITKNRSRSVLSRFRSVMGEKREKAAEKKDNSVRTKPGNQV